MTVHRLPRRPTVDTVLERIDAGVAAPEDSVPSGFPSLDALLGGGMRRQDLVVLGGDVGAGKSALALGIALRAAARGTPVVFFSGEMDEARLMERALAIGGRVRVDDLRSGRLSDSTRSSVGSMALTLRGAPLVLLPLTDPDFDTLARRIGEHAEAALVILDYLQLVPPVHRRATQDEDLALALKALKALALERNVPILVVAQLPHHIGQRPDPRPTLDDFGALGSVKQHADIVLALYREEMYHPGPGVEGATELIVAKNRNGPIGFVDLYFHRPWMRFEDMLDPDR